MVLKTLHVATATSAGPGGRRIAAALRWEDCAEPTVIVRRLRQDDAVPAGYRALVLGLWEARRAGARSLVLSGDDPEVVAQIQGAEPPPAAVIGAYLQVRALLNAFRNSRIRCAASEHSRDAATAAAIAVRSRRRSDAELPLWAAASKMEAA